MEEGDIVKSNIIKGEFKEKLSLPFSEGGAFAGFPSPAQDYMDDDSIDFNRDFVKHPSATFYCRVRGNSMIDAGIEDGDLAMIDRAEEAEDGDIVLAVINGEFTIKYLDLSEKNKGKIWLRAANEDYPSFKVTPDDQFEVWGVIVNVIKNFK